ncbi:hypothetical protein NDU88_007780 [Pleurodeles waltl]|uniref:Uncharacterized protein n=1 Tax=Pleurodeles waltl TaxID=8319 RepID=A0AAV7NU49_PLEWA|nr:hypothetical protein NDU88_007780 [Pleurodeles waltl]
MVAAALLQGQCHIEVVILCPNPQGKEHEALLEDAQRHERYRRAVEPLTLNPAPHPKTPGVEASRTVKEPGAACTILEPRHIEVHCGSQPAGQVLLSASPVAFYIAWCQRWVGFGAPAAHGWRSLESVAAGPAGSNDILLNCVTVDCWQPQGWPVHFRMLRTSLATSCYQGTQRVSCLERRRCELVLEPTDT